MSKYDIGFKLMVVNAYLAGEGGYTSLAKRFDVKSKTNIRKWVSAFKQYGELGLENKKTNATYSVQFKLDVLNYKLRTGDSFENVALKFGISEPSMVCAWLKKWGLDGTQGLSKVKGRPALENKANKEVLTREQLEKEIELLKVENAYLKKLHASGINIPNRMLKQNLESSMS